MTITRSGVETRAACMAQHSDIVRSVKTICSSHDTNLEKAASARSVTLDNVL